MNPIVISQHHCKSSHQPASRLFIIAASLLVAAAFTSSCSTAKGFGKDVEKTGDKIQDAASR